MASDAVTVITNDHRLLEGLFEQLKARGGDRRALVEEIAARLTAHARAEEQHVYPEIKDAAPDAGADVVDHAYHEHYEAEHLLRKVRNLVDSPHFDEALDAFVAAVKHHIAEEENEMLTALRNAVDGKTLQRLGVAFERARLQQFRAAGFEGGPDRSADDLDDATRAELYEMAKEADIPGRSSMTKDELGRALRDKS